MAKFDVTDDDIVVSHDPGRMEVFLDAGAVLIRIPYDEALALYQSLGDALMSMRQIKDGPEASDEAPAAD